jgi:dihydropteroate synthase
VLFKSPFGELDLCQQPPAVMGVLNVTPDSFSDGGKYFTPNDTSRSLAYDHAQQMISEGATFIDIGGESTRPGAASVSVDEELDRVIPVVERIAADSQCIISVDTSSPEVMLAAADAGAGLLNDVRAFQREGAIAAAVKTALPIAIMHMQGQPKTMQLEPEYRNVIDEVGEFLERRVKVCVAAGIGAEKIILDPGFGFGKSLDHNLELLAGLAQLRVMGMPLLVGMSRKSMIGALLNNETDERLYGGLALASLALERGANIIRTHDVGPTKDVVDVFYALSHRK